MVSCDFEDRPYLKEANHEKDTHNTRYTLQLPFRQIAHGRAMVVTASPAATATAGVGVASALVPPSAGCSGSSAV